MALKLLLDFEEQGLKGFYGPTGMIGFLIWMHYDDR